MKKNFGFLLFNQFEDLDFFGPWEMFALWSQKFDGPNLYLVSETGQDVTSSKGLSLKTAYDFSHCPRLDYLLIPGGWGTRSEVDNPKLIDFVKKQAEQCEYVLSVCTGAFILQKAGLLKNKTATTHWASIDRLKDFSEVNVVSQRYTADHPLWTSAGISAGIDMSLAFIAYVAGEKTAGEIQHWAEYYPEQKIYPVASDLPPYVHQD